MFRAKEPNNNRKDLNNMICQDTKALFESQTSQNDLKFLKNPRLFYSCISTIDLDTFLSLQNNFQRNIWTKSVLMNKQTYILLGWPVDE